MPVKTLVTAWFSDNAEARGQYLEKANAIFTKYGMTGATVYNSDSALIGDMTPHAVVMVDWEDGERCRACFESPEYRGLIPAREKGFSRIDITLLGEQG